MSIERETASEQNSPQSSVEFILNSSGKRYLEDLPTVVGLPLLAADLVGKTPSLRIKIAAYSIWQETRNFELIKQHFGERNAPSLDSLLFPLMNREDFLAEYDQVYEAIKTVEELAKGQKTNDDIWFLKSWLLIYLEHKEKGIKDEDIVKQKGQLQLQAELKLKTLILRDFVRSQRKKGIYDTAISKRVKLPVRKINKISRSWLLAGAIESHPGRKDVSSKTRDKISQFVRLRGMGLNNQEISTEMQIPIQRVEEYARFLLQAKAIGRIDSKNLPERKKHRETVVDLLARFDVSKPISLQKLYENSPELHISYETLLDIYREIVDSGSNVPLTKDRFKAAKENDARRVVYDLQSTAPINIEYLARKLQISRDVARSIFQKLAREGLVVTNEEHLIIKETEFRSKVRDYLRSRPGRPVSVKGLAFDLGIPYKIALAFYDHMKISELVPKKKGRRWNKKPAN